MTEAHEAARRESILDAARRLFTKHGPQKTTVADIAREAGVGVGTVYLEFDSKDAIVAELSGSMHATVVSAMRAALEARDGLEATFLRVVEARTLAFSSCRNRGEKACELVACRTDATRREQVRFFERERAIYVELFARAEAHGELGPHDAFRTAEIVQLALASLSPPGLFLLPEGDALARARDLARLLAAGLVRRG
jgi:AcrR family transcriptional regulator